MPAVNNTSMTRVSVSSSAGPGDDVSFFGQMSGDGRFVTFTSFATNLGPMSGCGCDPQVYLRDTLNGTTQLVSMSYDGFSALIGAFDSSVSDDGRFVVFNSDSTDLVPADTIDAVPDIFVRDMWSGTTVKIPASIDPLAVNLMPQVSGDGRYVTYFSDGDVFRYDMLTGQADNATISNTGALADSVSVYGDISRDGRYVVFESYASNLIDDISDTNAVPDIFLRDMTTGVTTRVSVADAGGEADDVSVDATVSDDGRFVAFSSLATNLAPDSNTGFEQIFIRDTVAGTTRLVTEGIGGVQGNGDSLGADLSADGRYIVFDSDADNLVANDLNGLTDVFLRDLVTGTTVMLSRAALGVNSDGDSFDARISADGHTVIFSSDATNLTPGDSNNVPDVFRVSLVATNAADYIIGSDHDDTIASFGGSDVIDGGFGVDIMDGGAGNDTYYVDNAADQVIEAIGGGGDTVLTLVSYTLAPTVEVEIFTTNISLTLPINLTGNGFAQSIFGNAGANVIDGKGGVDTMNGDGGHDMYYVDNAADRVIEVGGGGTDRVLASVDYVLGAAARIEILTTTAIATTYAINLTGNGFGQYIFGNAADNIIDGKASADFMTGYGGNDTYFVDNAGDRVVEAVGGGVDRFYTSVSYTLEAAAEIEVFASINSHGKGAIDLTGNSFGQVILGNAGANTINGKAGADSMTGYGGADIFVFDTALGSTNIDRISDFNVADDTILLDDAIFAAAGLVFDQNIAASAFVIGTAATTLDHRIIYNSVTGDLIFDANGSAAGGDQLFARLAPGLITMSEQDFFVI